MIRIDGVYKSFGTQAVLKGVSINIEDGDTLAVVGPSGVGKSVLLKLIMGILSPDSGDIFVGADQISSIKSERRKNKIREKLGVLFQSAALFDSENVFNNVAFPLRERSNHSRDTINDMVWEVLESLSLESYANRLPQQLSLGIRKRIGLARALIMRPKVLLFDEPNTGLDPLDGQEVYDLIVECKQRWGFTGVVISHEIPEVFQVSDRVVVLLNGLVAAEGAPAEIQSSTDPAVRQFLEGRIDGPLKIQ